MSLAVGPPASGASLQIPPDCSDRAGDCTFPQANAQTIARRAGIVDGRRHRRVELGKGRRASIEKDTERRKSRKLQGSPVARLDLGRITLESLRCAQPSCARTAAGAPPLGRIVNGRAPFNVKQRSRAGEDALSEAAHRGGPAAPRTQRATSPRGQRHTARAHPGRRGPDGAGGRLPADDGRPDHPPGEGVAKDLLLGLQRPRGLLPGGVRPGNRAGQRAGDRGLSRPEQLARGRPLRARAPARAARRRAWPGEALCRRGARRRAAGARTPRAAARADGRRHRGGANRGFAALIAAVTARAPWRPSSACCTRAC